MAKKQKAKLRTLEEKAALRIATGRPTKYDPSVIDKFLEYFSRKPYEIDPLGKMQVSDFPTLAGFAISIGIDRGILREWSEQYPDFSTVYKKAKDFQENYLMINGTKGLIQQPMAIFALKNYADMADKKEVKHEGQIDSKISVEQVELSERIKLIKGENET